MLKNKQLKFVQNLTINSAIKEPLVHFLIIAIALFLLNDEQPENPVKSIQFSPAYIEAFQQDFAQRHNREPTSQELDDFFTRWKKEEILYQEALKLGLDNNDPVIRQQLVKKMQQILAQTAVLEEPDKQVLSHYLQQHSSRYISQPKYSFTILQLSNKPSAELVLRALNNGADYRQIGFPYKNEKHQTPALLKAKYDNELHALLNQLKDTKQWHSYTDSDSKEYIVRLTAFAPATLPTVDAIKSRLLADWRKTQQINAVGDKIDALAEQYRFTQPES